jgi:formamidase
VSDDGTNELMDVGIAARRALLEMIDYLTSTYGFAREAAYVLASVAGELRISQIVDLPNALVSLLLPTNLFEGYRSPA